MFNKTTDISWLGNRDTPTDKYIYHYTNLNTAFEYILKDGALRMSLLTQTNDPRESKKWHWIFKNTPGTIESIDLSEQLSMKIRDNCKLCCFSMDDSYVTKLHGRGWSRPRMWAQYANNHKGLCLVFEKNKLIDAAKESLDNAGDLYIKSVNYYDSDNLLNIDAVTLDYLSKDKVNIRELINQHHDFYFFTKHVDWQQEREFRIVLKGTNDRPAFISIGDSLVAIVAGVDFPVKAYRPLLEFYCKRFEVPFGTVLWINGVPDLRKFNFKSWNYVDFFEGS